MRSSAYEVCICRDAFRVLVNMGWDYSTHVEILFLSSLAWDTFDHNVLRSILCICCNVEIHFLSTLILDDFGQHILSCIS